MKLMIHYLSKTPKNKLVGTALVRLDFNTADEWRMQATIPTLKLLLKTSQKLIVMSHWGRPEGFDKKLSLRGKAKDLEKLLKHKVTFISNFHFAAIEKQVAAAPKGSVFVLENIRFLKQETDEAPSLAKSLARLADFYVYDAFAVAHHASDSVTEVEKFLPSYAGLEMEKEIKFLSHAMKTAPKPLVVIIGGAKADDKLGILKYFKNKAAAFLVGGAAGNTLLFMQGVDVGSSRIDKNPATLRELRHVLEYKNIFLPVDWKTHNGAILDIGSRTEALFIKKLATARSIIWSGPMGLIEKKAYAHGTLALARSLMKNKKAFKLTGGGETVAFFKKHHLDKHFTFISTGGGAMLEYLEGKTLPAIKALEHSAKVKKV